MAKPSLASSSSYLTPPHTHPTPSQSQSHYLRPQSPYNPTTRIYANAPTAPVSFNATPPSPQTQKTLEEAINAADINTLQSLLLASCNLYPHMRSTALRYLLGEKYVEEPPALGSTIAGVPAPTSRDEGELPRLRGEGEGEKMNEGERRKGIGKVRMVPGKGLVIDLLSSDEAAPPEDEEEEERGFGRGLQARRGAGRVAMGDRKRKLVDFKVEKKKPRKFLGGRCAACKKNISRHYADSACRYHTGTKVLHDYISELIESGKYDNIYPGKSRTEIVALMLEDKPSTHRSYWSCCRKKVGELGCKTANNHSYE